jgi:hypothetical protein
MRIERWADAIVTVRERLTVHGPGGARALAKTDASPYHPAGALAISPGGKLAWTAGDDGLARRVDLASGTVESFDLRLVDAAYVGAGELVGVIEQGGRLALVEWSDADPAGLRPVALPPEQRVDWPYGSPYQFGTYTTPDWDPQTSVRIAASPWGTVVAQSNGLVCLRSIDGRWRCVRVAFAYQGWICGFAHPEGVVITSLHNARTGDVVWLDEQLRWVDAFDSAWTPIAPCVPVGDGFVTGMDDELVRFEGYPTRIIARAHVGGRAEDASITRDGAAFDFGERLVRISPDGREIESWTPSGERNRLHWKAEATPRREPKWTWQGHEDPDLGVVWRPDPERLASFVERVRQHPEAIAELPGVQPKPEEVAQDPEQAVVRLLKRYAASPVRRPSLERILRRLGPEPERDAFLRAALRASLPAEWANLVPTLPIDAWIRANVPGLHGGTSEDEKVEWAEVTADPSDSPAWCVRVGLASGAERCFRFDGFRSGALSSTPSEGEDGFFEGRDDEGDYELTVKPIAGFALGVQIESMARGVLLCTGALWKRVELASPDELRRLYYDGDADGLFVGRSGDGWVVDLTPDDLEGARPASRPSPRPEARALLEALVEQDQLALHGEVDADLEWAAEVAAWGPSSIDRAAEKLEEALVEHASVDELFAGAEELAEAIRNARGG